MDSEKNTSATNHPGAGQQSRRWRRLLRIAGLGIAVGLAVLGWRWSRTPVLPPLDLADVEPVVRTAVEFAQERVSRSPRSASAWGRLAMVLFIHNFGTAASDCFTEAARLDPAEPRWPYLHALNLRGEEPEQALVLLERAVHLSERDVVPRARLAEELLMRGSLEEAERHLRRILADHPEHPWAHLGLGRVSQQRGELEAALDHLQRSAREAPEVQVTHLALAEVYQRLGDRAAAGRARRRASDLPSGFPWPDPHLEAAERLGVGTQAMANHADHLLAQGRTDEAVAVLLDAVRTHPSSAWIHRLLGYALIRRKNFAEAEESLRQAIRLEPDIVSSHFDLGVCLHQRGNCREAATCYRETLARMPHNAFAHYNLALCLDRLGDRPGAVEELWQVVRHRPDFPLGHRDLGKLLAELGRPAEALPHLERAARLDPADPVTREWVQRVRHQGTRMP